MTYRTIQRLACCGLMLAAAPAAAQDASRTAPTVAEALPADVLAAVRTATAVRSIYPVSGQETFPDQILKADEIVFGPASALTLTALDKPWIAIIARRWKFADAAQWVRIARANVRASAGAEGPAGAKGADRPGERNRKGYDGDNGAPGGDGSAGATLPLPHIYIVGEQFTSPDGQPLPGSLHLSLGFQGIGGGTGGAGGRGGDGGHAGNGKEGAMGVIDCRSGGGEGGNGGASGAGGRGGPGGTGGNGADITYISLPDGIEQLSYARVVNVEGVGGMGGRPGKAGTPGNGGKGGRRNGLCKPKADGSPGERPTPADGGYGPDGADGKKGQVTAITVGSLSPLFD